MSRLVAIAAIVLPDRRLAAADRPPFNLREFLGQLLGEPTQAP